jgi:putative restriction endonuclease
MPVYQGLVSTLLRAFEESGVSAVLISTAEGHPRRFLVPVGGELVEFWIYAWTLTHGGGARRPADEYRIQMTSVVSPLAMNRAGPTLLLGYEPNSECFAGFDIRKHRTFTGRSPSVQIPITAVRAAEQSGFSFATKGNDEIAIGFRADQILSYALNADLLHDQGADALTVALLQRAAAEEAIPPGDLMQIPAERQRVVARVSRLTRDAGFRRGVVQAYNHTCAVTGIQLRLVEAAHVLPVGVQGSTDAITNGLCLSPTMHAAYDRAFIFLNESYVMRINPAQRDSLQAEGLGGGLDYFEAVTGRRIHLPHNRSLWPDPAMIRLANGHRGISQQQAGG